MEWRDGKLNKRKYKVHMQEKSEYFEDMYNINTEKLL